MVQGSNVQRSTPNCEGFWNLSQPRGQVAVPQRWRLYFHRRLELLDAVMDHLVDSSGQSGSLKNMPLFCNSKLTPPVHHHIYLSELLIISPKLRGSDYVDWFPREACIFYISQQTERARCWRQLTLSPHKQGRIKSLEELSMHKKEQRVQDTTNSYRGRIVRQFRHLRPFGFSPHPQR